jgi:hypothetical protein
MKYYKTKIIQQFPIPYFHSIFSSSCSLMEERFEEEKVTESSGWFFLPISKTK